MTDLEKIQLLREMTGKEPRVKGKFTMQELHGYHPDGGLCRDCKHRIIKQFANKYNKCALWEPEKGAATDIKVIQAACGKFERVTKK
jgi:hypothetical protein